MRAASLRVELPNQDPVQPQIGRRIRSGPQDRIGSCGREGVVSADGKASRGRAGGVFRANGALVVYMSVAGPNSPLARMGSTATVPPK